MNIYIYSFKFSIYISDFYSNNKNISNKIKVNVISLFLGKAPTFLTYIFKKLNTIKLKVAFKFEHIKFF